MHYTSTALAVFGLVALGSAHMEMLTPVPYGKSTLNNFPLDGSGSDFPCKQRPGVYNAEGASNVYPLGSTQKMTFLGSAVHGGGSCQISITYDKAPTKSSTWKVIHSIVGGCPMRNIAGNNGDSASATDPDAYSFTIPTTLPTGEATLAWTWFNKIGNREMYMNCAPVTLTASSSKRSDEDELLARNTTQLVERDTAAYNALPDMFVANIGNGCGTTESKDLKFPNPGSSVEFNGASTNQGDPTGSCATGGSSGPGGSSAAGSQASTAVASKATSAAKASTTPGGVFATVPLSTATAGISGGVFATVATSATSVLATPVASSKPVGSVASSAIASTPVASSASPANTGSAGSGSNSGSTGGGSAMTAGTACSIEGEWNCVGGTSFQRCASGTWSVVMQLSAGTKCNAGLTTNINITAGASKNKRSIRFSGSHLRRHLQKS